MNNLTSIEPFFLTPEMLSETAAGWQQLRDGVNLKLLFQAAEGYSVGLIRYQPGASVPRHKHIGDEHIFVLSGSQQDERGVYTAGSYIYNPEASCHSVSSQDGCLVLAHWLKPVQFLE
ncbi:MAG: cupin domain-containing protein [Methylococcaceae bacterium]|jgi:anti-sigma factor ChrR (cupin superfamily)